MEQLFCIKLRARTKVFQMSIASEYRSLLSAVIAA